MNPRLLSQMSSACAGIVLLAQTALSVEITSYLRTTRQDQPRSNPGFNLAADTIDLRGTITTKRAGIATLVTPQLVSNFAVAPDVTLETRATFSNWNEGTLSTSNAIQTKLTARSVLPMLAEIEGLMRHDTTGESHRKLRLQMRETNFPAFRSDPIVLKANATIEQIEVNNSPGALRTGVEAALVQRSAAHSASNRIGFRYTAESGATESQRQAAALSRTWAQNNVLRLGVEYELTHEAATLQGTLRLTWQGYF